MPFRVSIRLLFVFVGCRAPDDTTPRMGMGADDALGVAEEIGYQALWSDEGPAAAANVSELRTLRVRLDDLGMTHTHVRQQLDGVPVWGGEAIVHLHPDGSLAGFTDDLVPDVRVDTVPAYTAREAIERSLAGTEALELSDEPTADLWILRHEGVDHLVWRVRLPRVNLLPDDGIAVRFIDAHDGELVWQYDDLQTTAATCSGTTNFYGNVSFDCYTDGTSWFAEDTVDRTAVYSWNNTTLILYYVDSPSPTFASSRYNDNAIEALYSGNATNDFYYATFGRDGIDGSGGPFAITTHGISYLASSTSYSTNYVNAFWNSSLQMMVYGDGDGVTVDSLTTLDIAGHEMTHGVTQYEANLTYSGESGGLNESWSDVFGAMVERSMQGESADTWMVAEDTWTPATAGDALRYMSNPTRDGHSLDFYTAAAGSADVHYSSGIANLAFYLLAEGGTHPRGLSTTVVTGIGADDAADIWYLALTSYMTSSTGFAGARGATLAAAGALFGTTSTQYTQVGNAWDAVGVTTSTAPTCASTNYTGSISRAGRSVYEPSSSGLSVGATTQTLSLTGPASADFDLYLEKRSSSGRWSTVARSTGPTNTETISYAGSAGTYRARVLAYSGTGGFTLDWCR